MVFKATKESRELVRNPDDARKIIEAAGAVGTGMPGKVVRLQGREYTVVDVELVKR